LRPAHRGHRAESLGDQQNAVSDARIHRVERNYGIAAVGSIEIERLNQQRLSTPVALVLLR